MFGAPREILSSVIHCVNGVTCGFVLKEVIGGIGSADATCVWSRRCHALSVCAQLLSFALIEKGVRRQL